MNASHPLSDSYIWVFRGIFLRSLVAGAIGGIVYTILLTVLDIANVGLSYSGIDRVIYAGLSTSIFGAIFGLIYGIIFGFIDGIALSMLMSTKCFMPDANRLHLNLLSLFSGAITGISVILVLKPLDFTREQVISPDLILLVTIAVIAAWWGAHNTLMRHSRQTATSPSAA